MNDQIEELQEILDHLTVEYGTWRANTRGIKYRAIADNDRYEVLKRLVEIMKGRGKDKEYFRSTLIKEFVAKFFFPEPRVEHKTSAKRKGCYDLVYGQLRQAILEFWPVHDIQSKPLEVAVPVAYEAPRAAEKPPITDTPNFVAEDVTETPYKESDSDVQVDEEYAKLLGVKTNVWK